MSKKLTDWLKDSEDLFKYSGKSKICWFVHNNQLYEMPTSDYKIIYDILQKSKKVEG